MLQPFILALIYYVYAPGKSSNRYLPELHKAISLVGEVPCRGGAYNERQNITIVRREATLRAKGVTQGKGKC